MPTLTGTVVATWHQDGGVKRPGNYEVLIPTRVTDANGEVIFPGGVYAAGALDTSPSGPSLELELPANGAGTYPTGWQPIVRVTFRDAATEVYQFDLMAGGTVDLRNVAIDAPLPVPVAVQEVRDLVAEAQAHVDFLAAPAIEQVAEYVRGVGGPEVKDALDAQYLSTGTTLADLGGESARTYIAVPPHLLTATQGSPGGLDHYNGLPVFKFRTTTGDERACTPVIDIPAHWSKVEIEVQYVNLTTTGKTGDVRWRYEEGAITASAFSLSSIAAVVDSAQAVGIVRSAVILTGRTIPSSRRMVVAITRTNSNVADTLDDTVGVVAVIVRESA